MDYQKGLLRGIAVTNLALGIIGTHFLPGASQILVIIATEPFIGSIRTGLSLQVCSNDRSVTMDDRDNSVMVNALPVYYAFVHGPIRGSIGTCQSLIIGPALRIVKSEFEIRITIQEMDSY